MVRPHHITIIISNMYVRQAEFDQTDSGVRRIRAILELYNSSVNTEDVVFVSADVDEVMSRSGGSIFILKAIFLGKFRNIPLKKGEICDSDHDPQGGSD